MQDTEQTLTSASICMPQAQAMLALTIVWHPDHGRIGEQYLDAAGQGTIALGRHAPLFCRLDGSGGAPAPLGERCVARAPLQVRRHGAGGVRIELPDSRMRVDCDGVAVAGTVELDADALGRGAILTLGGAVLVCVHWLDSLPRAAGASALLGVGRAAIRLREQVRQAALSDLTVLLLGASGTGKEVAAAAIHAGSRQARGPLVAVNMAGLNESLAAADLFGAARGAYTGAQAARLGFFAEADGGTLFLDEIGATPAAVQPMLLRVLETGRYRPLGGAADVGSTARLIAATDLDLDNAPFNQPLLRRLEAFAIQIPPLWQRREDLGVLIVHFLALWEQGGGQAVTLPAQLVSDLCNFDWPGNIRQLGNVVRRLCMALQAGESPVLEQLTRKQGAAVEARTTAAVRPRLADLDDDRVTAAMERAGWQIRAAADVLGVSRPSLYKLLAAHPQIRRIDAIPAEEIHAAHRLHGGDVARCASALKTPSEPLRRWLASAAEPR